MIGFEYLNILKEYSMYFDFEKEDFDKLLNTDINIMGLMDERVYEITPLLMQIASYAYGELILNDFDERYYNKTGNTFDLPICNVIRNSFSYIDELANNECKHPTVLMFKDLMYGSNIYEEMVDDLSYSTEYVDYDFKDRIITFLSNVDEKIIDYRDSLDGRMYNTLNNVRDWKDLLRLFGIYGRCARESKLLVLDEFTSYCDGENWVKVYPKGRKNRDAYFTSQFYKIMKTIEDKIPDYSYYEDEDILETLYDIREDFEEYRAYHYEYVKSIYKEAKIFEKCHKM